MNIFVLDQNPRTAANWHCDNHLHKMLAESAQMLSTWAYENFPKIRPHVYKPAYIKHPCTVWVQASTNNRIWLILLCRELENLRLSLNYSPHKSLDVIEAVQDCIGHDDFPFLYQTPDSFIFAGDPVISIRPSLPSIPDKYKEYYRQKHKRWIETKGKGMTYKNRPIPAFMSDLLTSES